MEVPGRLLATITLHQRRYDLVRLDGPVNHVAVFEGRVFRENASALETALALELERTQHELRELRLACGMSDNVSDPDESEPLCVENDPMAGKKCAKPAKASKGTPKAQAAPKPKKGGKK